MKLTKDVGHESTYLIFCLVKFAKICHSVGWALCPESPCYSKTSLLFFSSTVPPLPWLAAASPVILLSSVMLLWIYFPSHSHSNLLKHRSDGTYRCWKPSNGLLWLRRCCSISSQLDSSKKMCLIFLPLNPIYSVPSAWNDAPHTPASCIPSPWLALSFLLCDQTPSCVSVWDFVSVAFYVSSAVACFFVSFNCLLIFI